MKLLRKLWMRIVAWFQRRYPLPPKTRCELIRDLLVLLPPEVLLAAGYSVRKTKIDPSFHAYEGSNLGRDIRRDEAVEWAKLALRDMGYAYKDADVALATELYYQGYVKDGAPS